MPSLTHKPPALRNSGGAAVPFSSSFKVWNTAIVGGNICLALPAAPLIALAAALEGECVLLAQDGGQRRLPVAQFVTGAGRTALAEGELLRSVLLPARTLRRRAAVRRAALRPRGRSAALLVAIVDPRDGTWRVTVTASTTRPVVVSFDRPPTARAVREALEQAVGRSAGWTMCTVIRSGGAYDPAARRGTAHRAHR